MADGEDDRGEWPRRQTRALPSRSKAMIDGPPISEANEAIGARRWFEAARFLAQEVPAMQTIV
jgi:hypothetical protein